LGLPGFGRKLPYIVDPDGPVRAIAPCAEAEGAGLRPTRSPFAKRLLIAEVPLRGVAHRAAFMSAANSRKRGLPYPAGFLWEEEAEVKCELREFAFDLYGLARLLQRGQADV
jgi:hypothetical protein